MSSGTQELRVHEEDHGADAITFENLEEGVTYLFIRPGQSFDSAVKAVQRVCPEMTLPCVQNLVRTHCPNIVEMNALLGADQTPPRFEAAPDAGVIAPMPMKATGSHRRRRPPRWARIAAVAVPALVGGAILAQVLHPTASRTPAADVPPAASQQDKAAAGDSNTAAPDEQAAASTYRNPAFEKIAKGGQMKCDPMGPYEAKCVDADGKVMFSEASVGVSVAFTFSYDYEKIGFRLFPDEESASAWSAEDSNRDLYQNVQQRGRVVLWGTDIRRLHQWDRSIVKEQLRARNHADAASYSGPAAPLMSSDAAPLPDDLAFLAFGTLSVTTASFEQAAQGGDAQSFQLLRAVQLVLGGADGSQLGLVPAGSADAVAIGVDANTGPVAEEPAPVGDSATLPGDPEPVPAVAPQPAAVEPTPSTVPDTAPPAADQKTADPTPPAKPDDPSTPSPEPEPEPEAESAPKPETAPASETDTAPAPEAEQPASDADPTPAPQPEAEQTEEPAASEETAPAADTPPAPPMTEEPGDDGLIVDAAPLELVA